jgi:membrane-bound metal-dependent hydrolase YbcI (DUF457 family)
MALAVTHVILTIVILDLFRHYLFGKHKFPRYLLVIGGIAGLLPDIDIPLTWAYNFLTGYLVNLHGTFTHSFIYPILFIALGIFFYQYKEYKWAKICFVISFGWFTHLSLDCLFGGYKTFFWPMNFSPVFCPQWGISSYAASIDAIILILWIVHEEIHNKIKDYI